MRYAYAVTLPFAVPRQAQIQLAILALSLLLLPITPSDSWKPQDVSDPTWRIVALLAVCVGLPYVALATTTPLLSRWLARIEPSLDPARFFAASNLGSFAGLLSYPFAFERLLSSQQQTRWWSWTYVLYAALFALCGLITMRRARGRGAIGSGPRVRGRRQRRSAAAVDRLVGARVRPVARDHQCDHAMVGGGAVPVDRAAQPLSADLRHRLRPAAPLSPAAVRCGLPAAGGHRPSSPRRPNRPRNSSPNSALQAATLFAGCMICHGEMVRLQPAPARLPKFYLAIAAGGALGGGAGDARGPTRVQRLFRAPARALA